ncbi:MAG: carbohydrate kinase family protein [Firmicutes bacterium]|nr:carbohydrate kinase family protein [Bacillota bacterium]
MNILVIGGSNVDIYGQIPGPLKMKDSNPGHVYQTDGGVGRNILENLARLGLKPRFITAIGSDENGRNLINHLTSLGIESHALVVDGKITPTYIAILDADGEMVVSVNDMEALGKLDVHYLKETPIICDWIKAADIIVVDTNLDSMVLAYLLNEAKKTVYIDAISATKALKLLPHLRRIATLKCSRREAESLVGQSSSSVNLETIGRALISKGIGELYITDGSNGSYLFKGKTVCHHQAYPVDVVSTSGAGDAFFSGTIFAKVNKLDPLKCGSAAAKIALESPLTNSPLLTPENLLKIIHDNNE